MAAQRSTKTKLFLRSGAGPYTYAAVAGVFSVNLNQGEMGSIDAADLDTITEEAEPTYITGQELAGTLNYLPGNATQGAIETAYLAQTNVTYRMFIPTLPLVTTGSQSGTAYDCTGFFSKFDGPKSSTGDKLTADFAFKPSVIAKVAGATYTVA